VSEASNIGEWVIAAGIIGNLVLVWWKLSGRKESRDITPQPLEVKASAEYARAEHTHDQYVLRDDDIRRHTDEERRLNHRFGRINDHLTAIGAKIDRHAVAAEERASRVHNRIDQVEKASERAGVSIENHLSDHRAIGGIKHAC
jgi:hypothetical protein